MTYQTVYDPSGICDLQERQWRWKERQKQKGEEDFFRKEAKRKRGSYVPVDDLNTSVKKKRRERREKTVTKMVRKEKEQKHRR